MEDKQTKKAVEKELTAREKLANKVAQKIAKGEALDNSDLLALQGKVWIFDPSVGAYHEVDVEEAEKFIESAKLVQEAIK